MINLTVGGAVRACVYVRLRCVNPAAPSITHNYTPALALEMFLHTQQCSFWQSNLFASAHGATHQTCTRGAVHLARRARL